MHFLELFGLNGLAGTIGYAIFSAMHTDSPAATHDGYKVRIARQDRPRFERVRGRLTAPETVSMLLDCWEQATPAQRKHLFAKAVSR